MSGLRASALLGSFLGPSDLNDVCVLLEAKGGKVEGTPPDLPPERAAWLAERVRAMIDYAESTAARIEEQAAHGFVSFVECADPAGAQYIVRWGTAEAATEQEAQERAIAHLADHRSIPTGPGGSIRRIETVPAAAILSTGVRRRNVPLFELDTTRSVEGVTS